MPETAAVKPESILLLGAGGHARVCAEALRAAGHDLRGHIAPEAGQGVGPYLGPDVALGAELAQGARVLLAIGTVNQAGIALRQKLLHDLPQESLATLCHPGAIVAPSANLAAGVFVAAGAIIGTNTAIGLASIINSGAVVDHDCSIGANTHIATGARLAGSIQVGDNCLIGVGASLRQGLQIGDGAIVGAGAVVIRDVAPGATVLGVPAS